MWFSRDARAGRSSLGERGSVLGVVLVATFWAVRAEPTPPTPPATIEIQEETLTGRIALGAEPLEIPAVVRFHSPAEAALAVYVGEGERASRPRDEKAEFSERFRGTPKEPQKLGVPIKVGRAGHFEVDFYLSGRSPEGGGFSSRALRHVLVERDGSYRVLTPDRYVAERRKERERRFEESLKAHPGSPDLSQLFLRTTRLDPSKAAAVVPWDAKAHPPLEVRPVGPDERLRRYSVERSGSSWAPEDPITVRGRLVFQDIGGMWRPLVNVSVNLWDSDSGFDEHLGVTGTDWNGNWSFSVDNDDGWLADGRDIYYSFKLENTRIRVQDCDGIDSTYEWESATHDDLSDGTVLDFGTETGVEHPTTMQVWSYLNLAWNHASTTGGRDPGFVDTCFPEGGGTHWDRFWEEIDIGGEYNDGPDVVTHEYGHAVMWYAYDEDNPSPGGSHGFDDCPQDAGLAWSEGWGTGFMLSARPDGAYNWHEGDGGRAIEAFSSTCHDGEHNEGRVAAALNDMLDAANDCNGSSLDRGRNTYCDNNTSNRVSLATMLRDTLWGGWHDDMIDFWTSLAGELSGQTLTQAHEVMYYNWMSVFEPGACVASRVASSELPSPEATITGLRALRDHGLKGTGGGQRLIQMYYRNSPEIALLLARAPDLRRHAARVVSFYGTLGQLALKGDGAQSKAADQPAVPEELRGPIRELVAGLEKGGSAELRRDLEDFRSLLQKVESLTIREAREKVEQLQAKRRPAGKRAIDQRDLTPASTKALRAPELKPYLQPTVKPPSDRR